MVSNAWRWPALMGVPTSGAVLVTRSFPRTRTARVLESIALRHQITVLERSRTRPASIVLIGSSIPVQGHN